jgi:hypothetical protein
MVLSLLRTVCRHRSDSCERWNAVEGRDPGYLRYCPTIFHFRLFAATRSNSCECWNAVEGRDPGYLRYCPTIFHFRLFATTRSTSCIRGNVEEGRDSGYLRYCPTIFHKELRKPWKTSQYILPRFETVTSQIQIRTFIEQLIFVLIVLIL